MKRIIAIILVCILAFSLVSCDAFSKDKSKGGDTSKDSNIIAPID